ncbi:hypothetical protein HZB03_02395 [Candidatus Woesearchaeota archaeon]|nr:hypothetical protein [Candidatus Woesearchaeota archaeon]
MKRNMKRLTQRSDRETTQRRVIILLAISIAVLLASAFVVEAQIKDSVRSGWGSVKSSIGSIGGWWQSAKLYMNVKMFVNFFVLFALLFILQMIFLKEHAQDEKQKYAIWGLCLIGTVIIGVQLIPQGNLYLWEKGTVADITRFTFGKPAGEITQPGCEGDGAYAKVLPGNRGVACRQAILRIGESGKGLPALIITFLVLYVIFSVYKGQLGMGEGGSSKLVIILPVYLAALIANQGATKNQIIVMGGWILVIVIYARIKTSMGEKGNAGLALGLAFAFVQIIANLLGSSLLGGLFEPVEPQGITIWWVVIYIGIGFGISFLYNTFIGKGGGIFAQYFKQLDEERQKKVDDLMKAKRPWDALKQSLPILGWFKDFTGKMERPKPKTAEEFREEIKKIYAKAFRGQPLSDEDWQRIKTLQQAIQFEEKKQMDLYDMAREMGIPVMIPPRYPAGQQQEQEPSAKQQAAQEQAGSKPQPQATPAQQAQQSKPPVTPPPQTPPTLR